MWNVMIETLQGKPQYFHGIDWDQWKPAPIPPDEDELLAISVKQQMVLEYMREKRARQSKELSDKYKAKLLRVMGDIKRGYTNEIVKLADLPKSTGLKYLHSLVEDGKLVMHKCNNQSLWCLK